jgi:hypothetical protein
MKMIFHFTRVSDCDITTEGATQGECYQKAIDERMNQFKAASLPATGGKEVDQSLVTPGKQ